MNIKFYSWILNFAHIFWILLMNIKFCSWISNITHEYWILLIYFEFCSLILHFSYVYLIFIMNIKFVSWISSLLKNIKFKSIKKVPIQYLLLWIVWNMFPVATASTASLERTYSWLPLTPPASVKLTTLQCPRRPSKWNISFHHRFHK